MRVREFYLCRTRSLYSYNEFLYLYRWSSLQTFPFFANGNMSSWPLLSSGNEINKKELLHVIIKLFLNIIFCTQRFDISFRSLSNSVSHPNTIEIQSLHQHESWVFPYDPRGSLDCNDNKLNSSLTGQRTKYE